MKTSKRLFFGVVTLVILMSSCSLMPPSIKPEAIELSESYLEIPVGGQGELTVTIAPDSAQGLENYFFEIDMGGDYLSYVQVDDTLYLDGLEVGQATITARSIYDNVVKNSAIIEIVPRGGEDPYFTSPKSAYSIPSNTDREISVRLENVEDYEKNSITWTSSDHSVVTLSGYGETVLVRPQSIGAAVIRASHPKAAEDYTIYINVTSPTSGIVISAAEVLLTEGQTTEIEARLTGSGAYSIFDIEWSKDDPQNALTLTANGALAVIEAAKEGAATVYARLPDNSEAYTSVVISPDYSLTINPTAIEVEPGETAVVSYLEYPAGTPITWTSSNNTVFTVDDVDTAAKLITIRGVSFGEASLQAAMAGQSAKSTVSVRTPYSLEVFNTSIDAKPTGDFDYVVNYSAYPEGSASNLIITPSDVNNVLIGSVTPTQITFRIVNEPDGGNYTIQIAQRNSNPGEQTLDETVNIDPYYNSTEFAALIGLPSVSSSRAVSHANNYGAKISGTTLYIAEDATGYFTFPIANYSALRPGTTISISPGSWSGRDNWDGASGGTTSPNIMSITSRDRSCAFCMGQTTYSETVTVTIRNNGREYSKSFQLRFDCYAWY